MNCKPLNSGYFRFGKGKETKNEIGLLQRPKQWYIGMVNGQRGMVPHANLN